jgi:hypothetical protein
VRDTLSAVSDMRTSYAQAHGYPWSAVNLHPDTTPDPF